ncbi:MAG: hypothetical protein HC897_20120, partial [Thermoanaerobaculia bacterium]|nr:hypothetical protein [Thermoanaerobaculia bacterium]
MRSWREPLLWLAVGALGAALLAFAYPRASPLAPERWEVTRGHAEAIALERLHALGEPIEDAYVVVSLRTDPLLERLLQTQIQEGGAPESLRASLPGRMHVGWNVLVYRPTAVTSDWSYRAQIGFDGEVLSLLRAFAPEQGEGQIDDADAVEQARRFLEQQGFEAERFEAEPEIERNNLGKRTDLVLRYRDRAALLGSEKPYGLEVRFAGTELSGFTFWLEEGERAGFDELFRQAQLVTFGRVALFYLLLPFVVVPFLKRYHDGQLGVRRGVQLLLGFLGLGLVFCVLCAQQISTGVGLGFVTREQTTWMVVLFTVVFNLLGLATLALASWSVGESLCRERWAHKLAAIDALFRLKWHNATFARSALRGLGAGLGV